MRHKGFTIIELTIAMGLFIILMGIAMGSFVRAMRTQRAIVALMTANDNASLALEQMAREIRTSSTFVKNSPSELQFDNAYGIEVVYRLNSNAIERGETNPSGLTTYKKITADNVRINNFSITLFGQNPGDGYPPRITISISATGTDSSLQDVSTNIQTTISARISDS